MNKIFPLDTPAGTAAKTPVQSCINETSNSGDVVRLADLCRLICNGNCSQKPPKANLFEVLDSISKKVK